MLGPVLLNLIFTFVTWWHLDRGVTWAEDRRWTWLLVILMVYLQWKAMNSFIDVVLRGKEERKKEFERRIGGLEPFLEATPQVPLYTEFAKILVSIYRPS